MSTTRLMPLMLLGALLLGVCSPANAQDIDDLQLFAPAEITSYGSDYPPQRQGWFGSVDWIRTSITAPDVTDIGANGASAFVVSGELGGDFPPTFPTQILPSFFPTERGRIETNTINTSPFSGDFTNGTRIEWGHVDGHWGWMCGMNLINPQTNEIVAGDVDVVFLDTYVLQPFVDLETGLLSFHPVGYLDGFINTTSLDTVDDTSFDILLPGSIFGPAFGRYFDGNLDGVIDPTNIADELPATFKDLDDLYRLPVTFESIKVRNVVEVNTYELMPFYRFDQFHKGGNLEVGVGLRFTRFEERFVVQGWGGILDDSNWNTKANNNIVGPQIMARWSKRVGRFNFAAQGRGVLGFNFQNVRQVGTLASFLDDAVPPAETTSRPNNLPAILNASTFNHGFHTEELAPSVELRAEVSYTVTKAFALKGGWTGSWQDGLARPSNMISYRMPTMGILGENNRQSVFMNGITLGVEMNR
ncbi:Uncharacterized protein SCF082_LOCUS34396 [Durusdinium trenchii]|uniref:Uncharacterized protein n=1 Tax=Durusdinium trenchii TaxID=1381693 RepID=A0ABP0NWN4_9DINO